MPSIPARTFEAVTGGVCQRYYSERQLSIYSGIAVRTLQGWRLRGQGPPWRKLGGAIRYDVLAFDAWAGGQAGGGGGQ